MNSKKLDKYSELLLLWGLCTVCMSATICIYLESVINLYSFLALILSALVLLFTEFSRKKKLGGLLYIAVLICILFLPALTIHGIRETFEFVRWFFSGSEAVETKAKYIFTLTVMMCFMFTSAAYYFTRIIYRSSLMTLISIIPFAIAVKTVTTLPYGYAAIVATLNIIIFIYKARKNVTDGARTKGKATLMVYADFTIAVILLALILPKPSVTPYYEKFEEITSRFQFGGSGETRYTGEYKDNSGVTDELRRGESILLYIVNTKNPVYVKTQVFDIYDHDLKAWVTAENNSMRGSRKWQENAMLLSYEKLGNAMKSMLETDPSLADAYPQAEKLIGITETESYSSIYTQNFPAIYVLAPLRATRVNLESVHSEFCARTTKGEIFTNHLYLPDSANYVVSYYTEDIYERLVSVGYCDVTAEEYSSFLNGMKEYFVNSDYEDVYSEFVEENSNAERYAENTQTEISAEIQALADEITAGLEYDYMKAEAIERYFSENSFVYDLLYEPDAEYDTPEYFLLESRRGICSDFATAYVLLARAAGLNARYVEGFVMQDSQTTPDMYYIYSDNAHAYPEVYIPGAGWVIFEPTPAGSIIAGQNSSVQQDEIDPWAIFFTAVIAVIVMGILVLIIIFTPKIIECIFRIRVNLSDCNTGVIMLYNRHSRNMEHKFGGSCRAMTPEQLRDYTEEKTQTSLEPLIKPFIGACYGAIKLTKDDKQNAIVCYKEQYRAMRRRKRRKD